MHRRHEAVTSAPPRMAADGGAVESAARQIRGDLPEGKTSARVASDSIDVRRASASRVWPASAPGCFLVSSPRAVSPSLPSRRVVWDFSRESSTRRIDEAPTLRIDASHDLHAADARRRSIACAGFGMFVCVPHGGGVVLCCCLKIPTFN